MTVRPRFSTDRMNGSQFSQEAPSRLLRLLHGFWGGAVGLLFGWLVISQLRTLAQWLTAALLVVPTIVGAALAFRFGSAFWHALMESLGDAGH